MNQKVFLATCFVVLGGVACAPTGQMMGLFFEQAADAKSPSETELVNLLVERLGVDSRQAMGGMGAIFALARQRMTPEDFMQLSNSVPNMEQYLAVVPPSTTSFQLGIEANAVDVNEVAGAEALNEAFQSLGMNPEMIPRFVTVVLQYLQQRSELAAMSLLQSAMY